MLQSGLFIVMGLPARPVPEPHEKDLMKHSSSFPLTAAQQDIWLDQLRVGDSPLYNIGGYVDFAGPIAQGLMQRAIELLVLKHDALRTQLHTDANGLPRQTFATTVPVDMALHDVSGEPDPKAASHALMQAQMAWPFTLQGAPLFRFFLVKLDDDHYRLGT